MLGQELVYQLGGLGQPWTDFVPSRPKSSNAKTSVFWFFLKVLRKVLVNYKINLEDTLIYGEGWIQCVPKFSIGQMECVIETQRRINHKSILSSSFPYVKQ